MSSSSQDPYRFHGYGVDYKGKFIGETQVHEARGDEVCSNAMKLVKDVVKATSTHKQRITLNISISGLKILDDKTSAVIHNFSVSKMSYVALDTSDARAFGFIVACGDGKYIFYGIKTIQSADRVVNDLSDMFQAVMEMKKSKAEEKKQEKIEVCSKAKVVQVSCNEELL